MRCGVAAFGQPAQPRSERLAHVAVLPQPRLRLADRGRAARLAATPPDLGQHLRERLALAAAVGTPCVGLFGPVPATRNGPFGAGHATVEPPPSARPPWKERKTDSRAMAAIGVEPVVAAATAILARGGLRQAG